MSQGPIITRLVFSPRLWHNLWLRSIAAEAVRKEWEPCVGRTNEERFMIALVLILACGFVGEVSALEVPFASDVVES